MKALIFAAGMGTRLKPFTDSHPKALALVGGVPMLERVILKLKAIGIEEIVINVHHFSKQIIDFVKSNDNFGITIHISDESDLLLDTGGGLLKAKRWLYNDDFIVHNADILTDVDIRDMISCHQRSDVMATLLVSKRETSRYLLLDDEMLMRGWENNKTGEIIIKSKDNSILSAFAFGGIHILRPSVFPLLEKFASKLSSPVFSIIPFYIEACGLTEIKGYLSPTDYVWLDVGKPEALTLAQGIVSTLNDKI